MFRFNQILLACATLILFGFACVPAAQADTVVLPTFFDRTSFNAVAPTNTTVDFQSSAPTATYANSISVTGLNFAFTGTGAPTCGGCGVGIVSGANPNFGLSPDNNALFVNASGADFNVDTLLITPSSAMRAIGFDFKGSNGTQVPGASAASYRITVTLVNGDTHTIEVVNPSYTNFSFVGFSSPDVDIASVAIATLSGGQPLIDNVSFSATAEPVPEPATMVLLGTGLAGVASYVRKRRSNGKGGDVGGDEAEEPLPPQE
ncbi:MAG TPA: PEP-CTERM sorting domain-containing protein [Pyrinomonadaceae bacterium]|nr:PEP-CTERM sorting domain-containing protein [Pyrinomonadaceae bacterium]